MTKRSILRTSLLLLPAQIVFRAGEALLPLVLATWFGRSGATDVYYFCWAVFAFAGSLVFSAYVDSAIVPIVAEERLLRRETVPRLLGALLTWTVIVGSALALLIGAGAFAYFRARYAGSAESAIAAAMVVPFSVLLVVMSVRTYLSTLLNADHKYFAQPVASSLGVATQLATIALLRGRMGITCVPYATLAGEAVAVGALAWVAFRWAGLKMVLSLDRPAPLRKFARLVASEVGGGAVTRINPVIDQLMASLAAVVGGATLLRYSSDVSGVPTSLLQAALLPVLLSHLAEDYAARDLAKLKATVWRALAAVTAILLAASTLLYLVRVPLLRAVFLRGAMDEGGVAQMVAIFPYHLVGIAPFGALLVLTRAHVALQNSRIMFSMGVLNASANVVFNLVLVGAMGLSGIALATSLVQLAVALVFFVRLRRAFARIDRLSAEPGVEVA